MRRALGVLRLISGAMTGGAATIVVVLILTAQEPEVGRPILLTYVAAGYLLLAAAGRLVLVPRIEAQMLRRIAAGDFTATKRSQQQPLVEEYGDLGRLFLVFQSKTIVALAVFESAALLGAVAARVEGRLLAMLVAGCGCGAMALEWPGQRRWEAWRDRNAASR